MPVPVRDSGHTPEWRIASLHVYVSHLGMHACACLFACLFPFACMCLTVFECMSQTHLLLCLGSSARSSTFYLHRLPSLHLTELPIPFRRKVILHRCCVSCRGFPSLLCQTTQYSSQQLATASLSTSPGSGAGKHQWGLRPCGCSGSGHPPIPVV